MQTKTRSAGGWCGEMVTKTARHETSHFQDKVQPAKWMGMENGDGMGDGYCGMGSMETCCATRQKRPATVGTCFMPFILFFSRSYYFFSLGENFQGFFCCCGPWKIVKGSFKWPANN